MGTSTGSPPRPASSLTKIALVCTSGGFLDGYSLLIFGVALLLLIPQFKLSAATLGIVASIPFLGMAIGALVAGPLADRIGRRPIFMVDMMLFLVSSVLLGVSQTVWEIVVLRFLVGVAVGFDMPTSLSMLSEFSPPNIRGFLTSLLNTAWVLGIAFAGAVGLLLYHVGGPTGWRYMLASPGLFAAIVLLLRRNVPETPFWLASAGQQRDAHNVSDTVRSTADLHEVRVEHRRGSYLDLVRDGYWHQALFVGSLFFVMSLATATMLTYMVVILSTFVKAGANTSMLLNIIQGLVYVAVALILQWRVIDRPGGRVKLAVWTCVITAASDLSIAFLEGDKLLVSVVYLVAIIAAQLTVLPVFAWSAEIIPTYIRATGQAIGSAGGKVGAFLGILLFPAYEAAVGWTGTFITFTALIVAAGLVALIFGMDTAGKRLESLEERPPISAAGQ